MRRLCERQTNSGGLNGRPEKLQVRPAAAAGADAGCMLVLALLLAVPPMLMLMLLLLALPLAVLRMWWRQWCVWTAMQRAAFTGVGCNCSLVNWLPPARPLQDVCYSWWCLSALSILGRLHWIDQAALTDFVLDCQVSACCCRVGGVCWRQQRRRHARARAQLLRAPRITLPTLSPPCKQDENGGGISDRPEDQVGWEAQRGRRCVRPGTRY